MDALGSDCATELQNPTSRHNRRSLAFIPVHPPEMSTLRKLGIRVGHIDPQIQFQNLISALGEVRIRILYLYAPYAGDTGLVQAVESAPGGLHRVVIAEADHNHQVWNLPCHPSWEENSSVTEW